jgi:hypothetical protein
MKGVLFTADSAFSILACLMIVSAYSTTLSDTRFTVDCSRCATISYDLLSEAIREGILDSNEDEIKNWVDSWIPENIGYKLTVERYYFLEDNITLLRKEEVGAEPKGDYSLQALVGENNGEIFRARMITWKK